MAAKDLATKSSSAPSSSLPATNTGASKLDWSKAIGKSTRVAPPFYDQRVVPNVVAGSEIDYAEFLNANLNDREKFDPSGQTIRESINVDLRWGAEHFYSKFRDNSFDLRRTVEVDGSRKEYPPPTTPYWKRALGHHKIEMTATVWADETKSELLLRILAVIKAIPIADSKLSPPFQQLGQCIFKIEHHVPIRPRGQKA